VADDWYRAAMADITVEIDGPVAVITMREGENRIGTGMVDAWNRTLDHIEAAGSVSAIVVSGEGRYWSTGLDLDEVTSMSETGRRSFMRSVDILLGRLMTLGVVTVAAINGHAYAAGGLLSLAHDYRIMRSDHGFFCLPSVDVGIPFSPGMSALVAAKLPQPARHDLVVSCRRIGGLEAERSGVVHRAVAEGSVFDVAFEMAHAYSGKDRATLHTVKRRLYPEATEMLTVDE
jgi:enoyl-CoA hydratase/carnithine racemase